jgi:hypothetical protein
VKKILIGAFALAILVPGLHAAELTTRLVQVGQPQAGELEVPVMAEGEGRVLWVNARDTALLSALTEAVKQDRMVRVDFNEATGTLKGVELLDVVVESVEVGSVGYEKENFIPSVLDFNSAQKIFDAMDGRTKRNSQCFNRAHGWAYDMKTRYNIDSMKIFIFFTSRYIREYRYKWWFHVAPMVLVATNNMSVEHVMDVSFTNGPTLMRNWTDYFMQNNAPCPSVNTYTEYRQNQQAQYCYLIRANMFYRSPRDLELLDTQGRQELGWNLDEVSEARRQAFKNWRNYNP